MGAAQQVCRFRGVLDADGGLKNFAPPIQLFYLLLHGLQEAKRGTVWYQCSANRSRTITFAMETRVLELGNHDEGRTKVKVP